MTTGTTSTTTTAPPQTTVPAQGTTQAPPATTTAPPPQSTTAASGTTTAAPGASTTAAPSASTTSAGGPSFAEGAVTIEIDPDPGIQQQPDSIQVPSDVVLTLKWEATNAASVNIDPGSSGQPASGSQSIPTEEQTYTLTAVDASGALSAPFTIAVHTHDPDEVVSGHASLASGASTTTMPPETTTSTPSTTTTMPPESTTIGSTTTSPSTTTTSPSTTTTAPGTTTTHSTTTRPPSTTTEPGLNGDNLFDLLSELLGHDGEPLAPGSSTTQPQFQS